MQAATVNSTNIVCVCRRCSAKILLLIWTLTSRDVFLSKFEFQISRMESQKKAALQCTAAV